MRPGAPEASPEGNARWLGGLLDGLAVLLGLVIVVTFTLHPTDSNDIWWHLKTGQLILQELQIPTTDRFSYTAFGAEVIVHEWLYEVLVFAAYSLLADPGLAIFRALVVVATAAVLLRACAIVHPGRAVNTLLLVAVATIAAGHFGDRPQILGDLLAALYMLVLLHYTIGRDGRRGRTALLAALPVLQLLWVNLHGSFVVGGALVVLFGLGELSTWAVTRDADTRRRGVTLLLVACALGIASLANPHGYEILAYPFRQVRRDLFTMFVDEWVPSFHPAVSAYYTVTFFKIWVVASALSCLLTIRRSNLSLLLVYLFFLVLSMRAYRFIAIGTLITLPVIARNVGILIATGRGILARRRISARDARLVLLGLRAAVPAALAAYAAFLITVGRPHMRGEPFLRPAIGGEALRPAIVADYIVANDVRGRMFNTYHLGGYLIWRLGPERSVFIDGRANTVYDEALFERYLHAQERVEVLEALIAEYGIDYFVLAYPRPGGGPQAIHEFLRASSDWVLVAFDDHALLYVRRSPANAAIIARDGYVTIDPVSFRPGAPDARDLSPDGVREYERAVRAAPDCVRARNNLGLVYLALGRPADAARELGIALRVRPGDDGLMYNLALAHTLMGDYDDAIALYEQALDVNDDVADYHADLGAAHAHSGAIDAAIQSYERALARDPRMLRAYLNLQTLHTARGDHARAAEMHRRALLLDPTLGRAAP
jgi:tetratricopeptide (TPR) repeat protein